MARQGGGRDYRHILIIVDATARHGTHSGVGVQNLHNRDIGKEDSSENRVLGGEEIAGIGGIAIVPPLEMIVGGGSGGDDHWLIIAVAAGTGDCATGGVAAINEDIGGVGYENGSERGVGRDNEQTRIVGIAVAPMDEMIVGVGSGLDTGYVAAASGLQDYFSSAHDGVVDTNRDLEGDGLRIVLEQIPIVRHIIVENGATRHMDSGQGSGRGKGVRPDGRGIGGFHNDEAEGGRGMESAVANGGDRRGEMKFAPHSGAIFESRNSDRG